MNDELNDSIDIGTIRREDVVQQLKLLGYSDVPDFLVEEFLAELRQSLKEGVDDHETDHGVAYGSGSHDREYVYGGSEGHYEEEEEEEEGFVDQRRSIRTARARQNGYRESQESDASYVESVEDYEKENDLDDYEHEKYGFHDARRVRRNLRRQSSFDEEEGEEMTVEEDGYEGEEEEEGEEHDKDEKSVNERKLQFYMHPPAVSASISHHRADRYNQRDEKRRHEEEKNRVPYTREANDLSASTASTGSNVVSGNRNREYATTQRIAQQTMGNDGEHKYERRESVQEQSAESFEEREVPPAYTYKRDIPVRDERKKKTSQTDDPKLAALRKEKEELEKRRAILEEQLLQQQEMQRETRYAHEQQGYNQPQRHHRSTENMRPRTAGAERSPEKNQPASPAPSTARSTTSSTQSSRLSTARQSHSGGLGGRRPLSYRKRVHDPVNRYKQLQGIWQKDKFLNGSGSRKNLRWQVRQEMLQISGDPYASHN